jgi:hypothetical protein
MQLCHTKNHVYNIIHFNKPKKVLSTYTFYQHTALKPVTATEQRFQISSKQRSRCHINVPKHSHIEEASNSKRILANARVKNRL